MSDSKASASDSKKDEKKTEEKTDEKKESEEKKKKKSKTPPKRPQKGDYTIQVHFIEVRDVKGRNAGGLSDPVCVATVLGQKQHTSIKKRMSSGLFDEGLIFSVSVF